MRVEILRIEECPNWEQAESAVRAAGELLGFGDLDVVVRVLASEEEAAAVPFAGSPTILIDGRDAFPAAGPTADLACRIYPTPSGFRGAPSVDQLVAALRDKR